MRASVEWLDANPGQSRNPLSAYGQFSAISSASGGGDAGEAVAIALERLTLQVSRMEARQRADRARAPRSADEDLALKLRHLRYEQDRVHQRLRAGEEVDDEIYALMREERRLSQFTENWSERATTDES